MNNLISVIVFVALVLAMPAFAEEITGKCTGVLDGDTIEVLYKERPVRIRLAGIDCPEKRQAFGQKAKQATSNICFGKDVTVDVQGHDRYHRLIANVMVDGIVVNRELLRRGLAWHYKKYAPKDKDLAALEADARSKRVGIWADKNPVPPWEFRKLKL